MSTTPSPASDAQGYEVRRKGTRVHPWRVLVRGDYGTARARFDKEREAMRQGLLQLIAPDGRLLERASAPFLRTRW